MSGLTPFNWPEQAVHFDSRGLALVLLALPAAGTRSTARQYARRALRQILASLLHQQAEDVPLSETARGPVLGAVAGDIRISLSYASGHCLIGLSRGREIGVDIVRIERIAGIDAVSRLYLPSAHAVIEAPAELRDARFALHWSQMEAGCKCLGLPLAEITPQREHALNKCEQIDCTQKEHYRMALAVK